MKALLAALLLALAAPAQQLWPYNIEFMPGCVAYPFVFNYKPAVLAVWNPRIVRPFLTVHGQGTPVTLVVREAMFVHPSWFQGQCSSGFPGVGTLLDGDGFATPKFWPWSGGNPDYFRAQNHVLPGGSPASYWVEHGSACCPCYYGSTPEWAAMILEVK